MKTAKARTQKNLRPRHKHTKEYLKHYYPFIPLFASIGFLLVVLLSPIKSSQQNVLAVATNVSPSALLELTNDQRDETGATELTMNERLASAAQKKAEDMVTRNYWSHKTPEGTDPWNFIIKEDYSYKKAGENLAYGFDSSDTVVAGWMNSKSHRENLLDKDFSEVGFGIANANNFNGSGASTVVVAMYGQPLVSSGVGGSAHESDAHILGEEQTIRTAGLFAGSSAAVYIVIGVLSAAVAYLLIAHGLAARKAVKTSETYIINHPLLDSTVITLIAVGVLLLRSVGTIL